MKEMPQASGTNATFTICSLNYLAYAITLFRSLERADPDAASDFFLILVDETEDAALIDELPFKIILAKDLGIDCFWDMAIRYTVMELNTAVKPAAFEYLFDQYNYQSVVYLDPDIWVVRPLDDVYDALESGGDIVLTPHSMAPLDDGLDPDDIRLLRTGSYNLGFLACANSPSARRLLSWWGDHMHADCRVDLESGLFVDQKFMDLAPAYTECPIILRHPGYNVAYWNLANRQVRETSGEWFVNDLPLHFFHFSGVVPGNENVFSKHQNRFTPDTIGDVKSAFLNYLSELDSNDHELWKKLPYHYGKFEDGTAIPNLYRELYGQHRSSQVIDRPSAFTADWNVVNAPSEAAPQIGPVRISRLMHTIWAERTDLQTAFPLTTETGRQAFTRWFIASVESEYGFPSSVTDEAKHALNMSTDSSSQNSSLVRRQSMTNWAARRSVSLAPAIRPIYRMLPYSWRVGARDFLLNKAASPTLAGILTDETNRSFDVGLPSGIDIYGYLEQISGVGEGARRMIAAVQKAGLSTRTINLSDLNAADPNTRHRVALFHINADQTQMYLDRIGRRALKGQYRIGYWAWELEEFPDQWSIAFQYVDEIWTPSTFVQSAVQKKTQKPVKIIGHPSLPPKETKFTRDNFGLPEDRFLFLLTFDMSSYVSRKNPADAYTAFDQAFPARNAGGPMLVVKLHGTHNHNRKFSELLKTMEHDDRVVLINRSLPPEEYQGLQSNCDALISLHKSEGFGMNILEFMALGKPVIATDYGGSTDFVTQETGYPVPFERTKLRPDEYPFAAGQVWASPSSSEAASIMKAVASKNSETIAKAEAARKLASTKYSLEAVGKSVSERITQLEKKFF